jgi:ATP-dependent 26S proteasome regulatory subunit
MNVFHHIKLLMYTFYWCDSTSFCFKTRKALKQKTGNTAKKYYCTSDSCNHRDDTVFLWQVHAVVGVLSDDTDPMVTVMKLEKAPQETYADIGGM